jgi:hypothetical protein
MIRTISPAAMGIASLVCGYGGIHRRNRGLLMLQAYFDDSLSTGKALVVGGFISDPARWEQFSDAWQKRLDHAPWDTFKMSEVMDRGGDESLEHAKWHYSEIPKFVGGAVAFIVPIELLHRLCDEYELPEFLRDPYHWAYMGIIAQLMHNAEGWKITEPVDFIFDERSDKELIMRGWESYSALCPPEQKKLLGRKPQFEDDQRVLPLQAADMWVWWVRKAWLEGTHSMQRNPIIWGKDDDFGRILFEYHEVDFRQQMELMKVGRDVIRQKPGGVELFLPASFVSRNLRNRKKK